MYPSDQCPFCNSCLQDNKNFSQNIQKYCNDCDARYNIGVSLNKDKWIVTFNIDGYYFQMFHNVFGASSDKLEIVAPDDVEIISIPECRFITQDNYLEEIERARKLQLFK